MEVYLDNSATTKPFKQVVEAMVQVLEENYGNPSSLHSLGLDSEKLIKKARRSIAKTLGVMDGEISFTSGGTEANNIGILGAVEAKKRQGKRIITSTIEHPSVLETFKNLETKGYETVYIGVDSNGILNLQELENAINEETILISVMSVNNETGVRQPIEEIGKIKKSAIFHTDYVQGFCKMNMDTKNIDIASISGHKIHGPMGSGALYTKKGTILKPIIFGGGQERGLRPGTENVPAIVGMGIATEIYSEDIDKKMKKILDLRNSLINQLKSRIDQIKINGEISDSFPAIVNISFLGTRSEVILHSLESQGVYISTGSACSSNKKGNSHVLTAMGCSTKEIDSSLRFSLSYLNTQEEIDHAVDVVEMAVRKFRRLGSYR